MKNINYEKIIGWIIDKFPIRSVLILFVLSFIYYSIVGTDGNIEEIRAIAPADISQRGWEIIRDEGYQYGSFGKHGGYVWYHVRNTDNHSIQYRVKVTLWNGRLEYWYGAPEKLSRFNVDLNQLTVK
jgi:hypothetical protein